MCMKVVESRIIELLQMRDELELRRSVEIKKMDLPKKQNPLLQKGAKRENFGGPYEPNILMTGHGLDE